MNSWFLFAFQNRNLSTHVSIHVYLLMRNIQGRKANAFISKYSPIHGTISTIVCIKFSCLDFLIENPLAAFQRSDDDNSGVFFFDVKFGELPFEVTCAFTLFLLFYPYDFNFIINSKKKFCKNCHTR